MEGSSSSCMGVVAVVAVSSSVAIVSLQVHKRLMSDFFKKAHLRLGGELAASSCSTETTTTTAVANSMGGCRLETVSRKRESGNEKKKKVRFAEHYNKKENRDRTRSDTKRIKIRSPLQWRRFAIPNSPP